MAGFVRFEDFSIQVENALDEACTAFLHEAAEEIQSQVQRNTRVDQGQLKNSWDYVVDESEKKATVGTPLENGIWEEFGTGEYAINGGRKGGWYVPAEKLTSKAKSKMRKVVIKGKEFYFTRGKTPSRAFQKAYTSSKPKIIRRAEQVIGAKMK